MNRIRRFLKSVLPLLLAVLLLCTCGGGTVQSEAESAEGGNLAEFIGDEAFSKLQGVDKLTLTIYYMNVNVDTMIPVYTEDLIAVAYECKAVVKGGRLRKHMDLLEQINNAVLVPMPAEEAARYGEGRYGFARMYFVFETRDGNKLFDVVSGGEKIMFINEIAIDANPIFYDIFLQFLPVDAAEELQTYLAKVLKSLHQ